MILIGHLSSFITMDICPSEILLPPDSSSLELGHQGKLIRMILCRSAWSESEMKTCAMKQLKPQIMGTLK